MSRETQKKVLAATGARVQERDLPVGQAPTRLDEAGELVDEDLRLRLEEILEGLAAAARLRESALVGA